LNPELIKDLKKAGLMGFTVHVDSHQNRPGWTGKSEVELNELRSQIAQMIHESGGVKSPVPSMLRFIGILWQTSRF